MSDDRLVRELGGLLFDRALRRVPDDAILALKAARDGESSEIAKKTLNMQLHSAELAAARDTYVCSDAGIPVFLVKLGTQSPIRADFKASLKAGYEDLVARANPPLLCHVTNPLTLERSHTGKGMPIVTFDQESGVDWVEIICSPKALGSGRWAALELFTFPSLAEIEAYVLDVAIKAGGQHCPPVAIGVGIGGTFDYAAKMAKEATLRPLGTPHREPQVAALEARLTKAINGLGYGPMGTGGDTTTLGVHVEWCSGHGFTPIAVAFNCWISRRSRVRIHPGGELEWME
ncbi:fumarate hydratase [Rhizobium sp. FY34]|uniref:fumarate hydratase n=1 Tax=Rhizobium sp. FY34 TaxID=2562309 RepID=UPI0010C14C13|nr:fumarate hydratase [Rhizobium sp. FY34]